jgi:hypothetical protein
MPDYQQYLNIKTKNVFHELLENEAFAASTFLEIHLLWISFMTANTKKIPMKKVLFLFVLMISFVTVNAQTVQSADENLAQSHAEQMKKTLNLTDQQTTQVQAVLLTKITAIHAIQNDASKSNDQKTAAIAQANTDADNSLAAILTADQMTQYRAIKKTRQDRANASGASQQ